MHQNDRLKDIEERWSRNNNHPLPDGDIVWLIHRLKKLTDTLKWIMPKVHQGYHEGEFENCQKSTCAEYRKLVEDK